MGDRVSILIPCYQQGHFLPDAVESALAQTHRPLEIIVINDGSTDATGSVTRGYAAKYPDCVKLIEQTNQGQARARQAGLDGATGQFLVMLDADDMLEPWMIERCLETFTRTPEADAVVGDVWLVDESGRTKIRLWDQSRTPAWPEILNNNPYGALVGMMVRTDSVRTVGGLAVDGTPGVEDWDLWARMARCGMRFVPLRQQVGRYRQSPSSYSRKALKMLLATLELLDRCGWPDPRLACLAKRSGVTIQPPISGTLYQHLRNAKVFKALGLAICCGGGLDELDEIAAHLVPGRLSVRACSDQFLEGIHFGFFQKNENTLNAKVPVHGVVEILERRMRERELGNYTRALRRELMRTMEQPFRKRSLVARLKDRLHKAFS